MKMLKIVKGKIRQYCDDCLKKYKRTHRTLWITKAGFIEGNCNNCGMIVQDKVPRR